MERDDLPGRFSPELHKKALENLIERFTYEGEEAVYYKDAADDINTQNASTCYKALWKIGLIHREKAGYYSPPKFLVSLENASNEEMERRAKKKLVKQLQEENDLFNEVVYLLNKNSDYTRSEIAKKVAGKQEYFEEDIEKVERFVGIFEELGVIEAGEGGKLELSLSLDETEEEENDSLDQQGQPTTGSEGDKTPDVPSRTSSETRENVEINVKVDLADIDKTELKEKLEILEEHLPE